MEDWYRHRYFNNQIDISGSGVEEYSFAEIRNRADFDFTELDQLHAIDGETVGCLSVRSLLADRFANGDPDQVMTTSGANEGLHLVVRSILEPKDEVITLGPCYHCHDKIAESMGCTVKKWAIATEENTFSLNFEDLKKLISSKTKALFVNFPHNPTGMTISQAMADDIVNFAREHDIFLVWDAVFQYLTYENPPLKDPVLVYEKAISLGTFSKAYGAPGLRFGWLIGSKDVIAGCVRQKDYGNLFVAPLIEFVAEKMLRHLDSFAQEKLLQATENRAFVNAWAKRLDSKINWREPGGGVCGALQILEHYDDVKFCDKALADYGVLLVPGSCFGMPGFARLGFGGNGANLKEGLNRLKQFITAG
ncbi:aminotransferase class I/II-fold pyridoxal phosphate-dependent enzyme [Marinicella sp. W31]|uniref:aminotransferase class I/II-fold pyridoxal phosphate-dependent enzyme n=1 Tax=Marinicella sp. W31 TaxID=3023713 RepID=UPI003757DC18